MHDQLLIYFSDHQIFTLMMTFYKLPSFLLPINFLTLTFMIAFCLTLIRVETIEMVAMQEWRHVTGNLWRLRRRARQSRGGDRADDGQNAPVGPFVISSSGVFGCHHFSPLTCCWQMSTREENFHCHLPNQEAGDQTDGQFCHLLLRHLQGVTISWL